MGGWFSRKVWRAGQDAVALLLGGMVWAGGASVCLAQTESPFAIRVETPEVVVPVVVIDRSHRVATGAGFVEMDEEVTDLSPGDFRVFEDGVEQPIDNVSLELPRIRDVQDNVSHHFEDSFTPRGIWASPDLWPPSGAGPNLSPLRTYLISYAPPASSGDTCHRIRVQVKRRHAAVYAREEYCNTRRPLSDAVGGTELGKHMEEFADAGKEGEIPVAVQAGFFDGDADRVRIDVAVEFPWSVLKRKWVGVNLYATVAVMGVVRDKNGMVVARFSDMTSTLPWNFYRGPLPPDRHFLREWESAAIPSRYETQMELAAGTYKMEIVVTDGEKFGRKEVPVNVDGRHASNIGMGDVVLCKRFHNVLEGAQAAARAPKYVPLVSNGVEFTPAGDTRFHGNERLVGYFEIYAPLAGDTVGANFQMRVMDAKTGEVRMDTGWRAAGADARAIPVAAEMEIDALSPGAYVLEVQVADDAGRVAGKRVRAFVVEE
ncbi:MAG: hypothetical protein WAK48_10380 [Candidatus Acidiferrum sp.]